MDDFDDFDDFNDAIEGLTDLYEDDFSDFVDEFIDDDPFGEFEDLYTGQKTTKLEHNVKTKLSSFQKPFAETGFQLGQSFYDLTRSAAAKQGGLTLASYKRPVLDYSFMDANMQSYWTISGMLKRVIEGGITQASVAQAGSAGVAQIVRASSIASSKADSKTKKKAILKTEAGACAFCLDIARFISQSDNADGLKKAKFHNKCNCALVFSFR